MARCAVISGSKNITPRFVRFARDLGTFFIFFVGKNVRWLRCVLYYGTRIRGEKGRTSEFAAGFPASIYDLRTYVPLGISINAQINWKVRSAEFKSAKLAFWDENSHHAILSDCL